MSPQIGHQQQMEGTSLPKYGLMNQKVYLGYVQGLGEGSPTGAWMTPQTTTSQKIPTLAWAMLSPQLFQSILPHSMFSSIPRAHSIS